MTLFTLHPTQSLCITNLPWHTSPIRDSTSVGFGIWGTRRQSCTDFHLRRGDYSFRMRSYTCRHSIEELSTWHSLCSWTSNLKSILIEESRSSRVGVHDCLNDFMCYALHRLMNDTKAVKYVPRMEAVPSTDKSKLGESFSGVQLPQALASPT